MRFGGIYTFVCHPSVMNEKQFERVHDFLESNHKNITSLYEAVDNVKIREGQGVIGILIEWGMYICRGVRKWIR